MQLSDETVARHEGVVTAARTITGRFPRTYWVERARAGKSIGEMWAALAKANLLGLGIPESRGGSGGGMLDNVLLMEALASAGVPTLQLIVTGLAHAALWRHATQDQFDEFVRPSMSGDLRICLGVTEPDAGTNTFAIQTTARRGDTGGWLIRGQKTFISCADEASVMLTVARVPDLEDGGRAALSVFLVPLASPGITCQKLEVGIVQPDYQFTVFLDDVVVPESALVGEPGKGTDCFFDALHAERLIVAAMGIGLAAYALGRTVEYVKTRAPFGRPIGSYQAVQHPMAELSAHIEAARQLAYFAAERYDAGDTRDARCSMAKLLGAEVAVRACDIAIQAHGGYGFATDYDVLEVWPLARLLRVAPINDEMVLNSLAQRFLGLPKSY